MLLATIIDKNTGKHSFLHSNMVEGEPKYCGYGIGKSGLSGFDMNIFKDIYEEIKMKPNAKFIMKYKGYDVYLDEKTGYKHYIKEGTEDFLAFIEFNRFSNSLCAKSVPKEDKLDQPQENKTAENIAIETESKIIYSTKQKITNTIFALLVGIGLLSYCGLTVKNVFDTYLIGYNEAGDISYFNKVDSYEQICHFVNNSPYLTAEDKAILLNKEYLEDVLPYFKDNEEMYYLLNGKLSNLQIEHFEYYEFSDIEGENVIGYYIDSIPNIIFGKEGAPKKDYLFHEWDHLFSSEKSYLYLREAVAAINEVEYDNSESLSYSERVKNVKLLMEVIGPRIVWRHVRTGKTDELHEILKNNLTEGQFKRFINILKNSNGEHEELTELIHILYKNIYGTNIKDDKQIYDFEGNFRDYKIYFNESKMVDDLVVRCDMEKLVQMGLVSCELEQYKYVTFTQEQFDSFCKEYPAAIEELTYHSIYLPLVNDLKPLEGWADWVNINSKNGESVVMEIDEAIKLGLYQKAYEISFSSEQFRCYNPDNYFDIKTTAVSKYKSLDENVSVNGASCAYCLKSIRQRFPDQTIRIDKGESRTLTINS